MITAHKKSHASEETSVQVCASSARPATSTVNDGMSSLVKKDGSVCTTSISTHRRTDHVSGTSMLAVPNSFAEYAKSNKDQQKVWDSVNRVAKSSTYSEANDMTDEDNGSSYTNSRDLFASNERVEEMSESEVFGQKNSYKMPDMTSALAKDMVNLYRCKVLPKINSCNSLPSIRPNSTIPALAPNSGIDGRKIPHVVTAMQVPSSSTRQLKRTVVAKTTFVRKSPFKLIKTCQPLVSHGETGFPTASKPLQPAALFDRDAPVIPGKRTHCSTLTSSCSSDTVSRSTAASSGRVISGLQSIANDISVQITQAVSSTGDSAAVSDSNVCITVPPVTYSVCKKNTTPKVKTVVSSKYKLIRRRESACKNTSRRTVANDTDTNPHTWHRTVKHTPTLLVVNKYKLVRKKRRSLTLSTKGTPPDVKKTAPSTGLGPDIVSPLSRNSLKTSLGKYKLVRESHPPHSSPIRKPIKQSASDQAGTFCRNSSAPSSKTRTSRYKLVRASDRSRSTSVEKFGTESPLNQVGGKVQVLSKYKLIRRKSTTISRTPHHAASTPAKSSQNAIINYVRHPYNKKHTTPPLFLNKYKLIRKRALLRTNFSPVGNSMLRSSHFLKHSSKPLADGFRHRYCRKQHAVAGISSPYKLQPKKRHKRNRSFLSKYALRRSGRGR